MGDRFFRRLWQGSAPFITWALHFFLVYVLVAAGCGTAFESSLRAVLLSASVLALAAIAWPPLSRRGQCEHHGLLGASRLGSAVLACIGVLWATLPMLWLPLCGWP